MKTLILGVGAAGNKAVVNAVNKKIVNVDDTVIINSTSKDFPKDYEGTKIVLSNGDTGAGKERSVAKEYTKKAIGDGKFNFKAESIADYITVIIVTSVEGGTGSGSAPLIAKMFNDVFGKNVHIIAFTGFEDDVRGLANTVEFFKEIDSEIMVQTISNKAFLQQANGNKLRAEELANNEMAERISVLTGQDFIDGSQNIDDTDILKLSNTAGYMTVEKKFFNKSLETVDDFNKVIKSMIYNSASIKSKNPAAIRIGVILNIKPESEDAVDYNFEILKDEYRNKDIDVDSDKLSQEFFLQVQWDGKKEYIAYIASGMLMPIDEIEAIYEKYRKNTETINKAGDAFFTKINDMNILEEDNQFDMMKSNKKTMSFEDFLSNN